MLAGYEPTGKNPARIGDGAGRVGMDVDVVEFGRCRVEEFSPQRRKVQISVGQEQKRDFKIRVFRPQSRKSE